MNDAVQQIVAELPRMRSAAEQIRETVLANLVMIGEIPSPTGAEAPRVDFIIQRLAESGLQDCSRDEANNGFALLPGTEGKQTILLAANADTLVEEPEDQTVEIGEDQVVGPFVVDNSLALAGLVALPLLLEKTGIRLRANLLLMAAAGCLGRGNLSGLKTFLAQTSLPVQYGLCLEGVQLGRLNYSCLGMLRGEITARLPDDYDWIKFGASGAILPINDVINQINRIPLPQRPPTRIVFGAIEGGVSYHTIARDTRLRFEARSESLEILNQIREQLDDICEEVSSRSGIAVRLDVVARRAPGGIEIGHPLVKTARAILAALDLTPMMYATASIMSALVDNRIPAVTLGLTTGHRRGALDEIDESVAIAPMATGLTQIAGLLQAMDGGLVYGG